ncbi:ferredoxin--NADP reductase [Castellaniella denitrificans]|uniref:FAD-dependent oxidoreductase n=1 Tax=Castellaniella denitrificans TaxID=56119 RepID=A0ABT4M677_9BURK|nr:FAD-dependent oxidoreductase [Castellaniella denitrificans]MCZ4329636.1 FAD-dependent oxidoreductase [Castellaniella denitrificans]
MATWPSALLRIDDIARDTVAVHFRKPGDFQFLPGQTLSLTLPSDAPDVPVLRHTFSLVSAPHESDLCIATRMRATPFKQALARLRPGAELRFGGPYGKLTPPAGTDRPLVLIAGGIGITPCVSMLRDAAHQGSDRRFMLLYSNRTREQAAFLEELRELARLNPRLRLLATLTGPADDAWDGLRGRIDSALLEQALRGLDDPLCYVTGIPAMVEEVRAHLAGLGVADDAILDESFHGY